MSQTVVWGTGQVAGGGLYTRVTPAGDRRVTADGSVRVLPVPQVISYRKTPAGDRRVTPDGFRRRLAVGPASAPYFATADVTSDGGVPFTFSFITDPWQPAAQSGECLFTWAYVTLSWSMAATVRVYGIINGSSASKVLSNGDLLVPIRPIFQLAQQEGAMERVSEVFAIPLSRMQTRGGNEITRFYQRGQRLQVAIESTGALGIGELMLEGIEVEFEPVRKSIYATVDSGGA
jgi:hypothetical protein